MEAGIQENLQTVIKSTKGIKKGLDNLALLPILEEIVYSSTCVEAEILRVFS